MIAEDDGGTEGRLSPELNPLDDPDVFDTIVLCGVISPGIVKLSGHDRNQDWDVKAASGQAGASTTRKGETIAQFTATFSLIIDPGQGIDDFSAWPAFQRLIESSTSGNQPKALEIFHPDLARNRITAVVNGGIGGMVHDGKGGATITVKFLEYRPPQAKKATGANGAQAGRGSKPGGSSDPAIDSALNELNGLLGQGKQTPQEKLR